MPCFLIAEVGHLKISQPEVTIACCSAAYQGQVCRALSLRWRGCWTALDAMVGHLFVGYVSGFFAGHVAAATVRLIGMVLGYERRRTMAGKTSTSEISDSLFSSRRIVRVVAGDAGKTVSALSFALTLQ
jgi:hypothetical protein